MRKIAVIGDFDSGFKPHTTIGAALSHSNTMLCLNSYRENWIDTVSCEDLRESDLSAYDGFWIAPGSPYKSMTGALRVIEYARSKDTPLLGTCGGFQHVVLEYARNVMGFSDAQHAEYDPDASTLFISELTCSLAGQTMLVDVCPETAAHRAYNKTTASEEYYCNFGLNLDYLDDLKTAGMTVSGVDSDKQPRILELSNYRFFVATLFVPQTLSTPTSPHPIVSAFMSHIHDKSETPP